MNKIKFNRRLEFYKKIYLNNKSFEREDKIITISFD